MSAPADQRRLLNLLELVLELDPALRGAYLENLGRQQPELRQQVVALLRTLGGHDPDDDTTAPAPRPAGSAVPERVGPYQVLHEIGRGGMSRVYLAERADEEFERQVALKVIDQGLESPIAHQRFLAERQILASFDCPQIAKLYDGGTLPSGRPYLVMELVHGVPADQFCTEKGLDLRARLQLFRQICGAVSYAHQRLVIHRDLKPSNILVKEGGEPKLLDFGIAKLLDPEAFHQPLGDATRTRFRPMTPSHASPEQLLGEPIGTATDVYALGVVLFQLLTGALPHPPEDRLLRVARERAGDAAPPKASESLDTLAAEQTWAGQDLHRLARQLRGDLDNIVAQALAPQPFDRYASVAELDEDLRRYLAGETVRATRETPLYNAGKFLGRYRFPVVVAALVLILLSAFALFTGQQAGRIAAEREHAEEIRLFLANLIGSADSQTRRSGTVSLKELLDDNLARLSHKPFRDRRTQVAMLELLGDAYGSLDLDSQAVDVYSQALAEAAADVDRPGLLFKLGRAGALSGRLDEAQAALAAAATPVALRGLAAQARNSVAMVDTLIRAGDLARAGAHLHYAFSLIAEVGGETSAGLLADALQQRLALVGSVTADAAEIRRAGADLLRAGARRAAPEVDDWEALARAALAAGDLEESLEGCRFLLSRRAESPGAGATFAREAELLAAALLGSGRLAEAEEANRLGLAAAQRQLALAPGSPWARYQVGQDRVLRGEILLALGRQPEGLRSLQEAIGMLEPLARETRLAVVKNALARACLLAGRRDQAAPLVANLLLQGWQRADFTRLLGAMQAWPPTRPRAFALEPLPPGIVARLKSLPAAAPPWQGGPQLPTVEAILAAEAARTSAFAP